MHRFASPRNDESERLQAGFDRRALRLQEGRQRQLFAERLGGLVGGEARLVGGDLEEDAVGLPEVEAAEVEPVDLAAVRDAEAAQPLGPGVDNAAQSACGTRRDARRPRPAARRLDPAARRMQLGGRAAGADLEDVHAVREVGRMVAHLRKPGHR